MRTNISIPDSHATSRPCKIDISTGRDRANNYNQPKAGAVDLLIARENFGGPQEPCTLTTAQVQAVAALLAAHTEDANAAP